jgi:hypothetical protein
MIPHSAESRHSMIILTLPKDGSDRTNTKRTTWGILLTFLSLSLILLIKYGIVDMLKKL